MNKFVKISIAICVILFVLILFRHAQEEPGYSGLNSEPPGNASLQKNQDSGDLIGEDEAINIAVRGIILTQGEKGEETWRLNATSASFDQASGKLIINQPRVTYFLKGKSSELLIQSRIGRLNQAESEVEMWDNVRLDESDNVLTTSRAIYNGNTSMLKLPEPVEFFNPQFTGSANQADWDLNTHVLSANGDVHVVILSRKKQLESEGKR